MSLDQTAERLTRALRAAGVMVEGVDASAATNRATWKVQPVALQSAAQPIINAFNVNDPTLVAQELSDQSLATSRQKDILATLATSIRGRNVAAWNALTTPQKVSAVLAEADVWKTIREFIDDKT